MLVRLSRFRIRASWATVATFLTIVGIGGIGGDLAGWHDGAVRALEYLDFNLVYIALLVIGVGFGIASLPEPWSRLITVPVSRVADRLPHPPPAPGETPPPAATETVPSLDEPIVLGDVTIHVIGADLSGLWRTDPFIVLQFEVRNATRWQCMFNALWGEMYVSGDRCNTKPRLDNLGFVLVEANQTQRDRLVQPVTNVMATAIRDRLANPGVPIRLSLGTISLAGQSFAGQRGLALYRPFANHVVDVLGPVTNAVEASNFVHSPGFLLPAAPPSLPSPA